MRDWLNAIFAFIGATSLTDEEYNSINFLNLEVQVYNQAAYDQLAKVLISRESISSMNDRLVAFFAARGTIVTAAKTGKSNIWLGSAL